LPRIGDTSSAAAQIDGSCTAETVVASIRAVHRRTEPPLEELDPVLD
jgi:hypothetical protein